MGCYTAASEDGIGENPEVRLQHPTVPLPHDLVLQSLLATLELVAFVGDGGLPEYLEGQSIRWIGAFSKIKFCRPVL